MALKICRKIPQIKKELRFDKIFLNVFVTSVKRGDENLENKISSKQKKCEKDNMNKVKDTGPIVTYLKTIGSVNLIDKLPKEFLRRRKKRPQFLYIVDTNVAKEFASLIADDLTKNSYIIEVNPGLGLLTRELLKFNVQNIYIFESLLKFINHSSLLIALINKHSSCLKLKQANLLHLWKLDCDEDFQKTVFKEVHPGNWTDPPYIHIVGSVADTGFIDSIIRSFINKTGIMNYGRPKMYLAVHPSLWAHLTSTKDICRLYRWRTILFQLLFDYKQIGTLNRKSFLPWGPNSSSKRTHRIYKELISLDNDYMYVVQIEPKVNFFTQYLSEEDLLPFWYFVRHNTFSRKTRVIPELEKWIPGCGPRLIALDINIFTEFGNLSPNDILNAFKIFKSCPGYDRNGFLAHMEELSPHKDIETEEHETIHEIHDA